MPKSKELHKVISILSKYGVKFTYSKRGRHRRKFYRGKLSFPVKTHGKKTGILPYALKGLIKNLIYHKIYLMKKSSNSGGVEKNGLFSN